jgi:hypothetical protein
LLAFSGKQLRHKLSECSLLLLLALHFLHFKSHLLALNLLRQRTPVRLLASLESSTDSLTDVGSLSTRPTCLQQTSSKT